MAIMTDLAINLQRPWSPPTSPWIMRQKWHDLLFMHWPISPDAIRPLIPSNLELETFDGTAWIGVVPFLMSGVRPRALPPLPGISAFPELNVRTYVRVGDKPGIWFFSLDAASAFAVPGARFAFHLPYFRARMLCVATQKGRMTYRSERTHSGAPPAELHCSYRPTGPVVYAQRGTLEYFLTERYCLYAAHRNRIFICEIDHAPWPLQPAEVEIERNTMAAAAGITLPNARPLLHFAKYQDVKTWGLKRVV